MSTPSKSPNHLPSPNSPSKNSTIIPSNLTIPLPNSSNSNLSPQNVQNTPSKTLSSGSATGNPRNKCALKPGHSLMDWIRLGTSGIDLTGTKGIIKAISYTELSKHCTKDDAWIAIRGKVFNVTRYMDFHPGGSDELSKGIGKDATKLFNEIHAWVNYEQLLAKCFIGPLRNVIKIDLEPIKPRQKSTTPTPESISNLGRRDSNNSDDFKTPQIPIRLSNSEKTSPIKNLGSSQQIFELKVNNDDNDDIDINDDKLKLENQIINVINKKIIPRFDWIQKTAELALIFYTKPFCNPGVIVTYKNSNEIIIKIYIDNQTNLYHFQFQNNINWPCVIRLARETGKIEIICSKIKSELWTAYGQMNKETFHTKYNYDFSCNNDNGDNNDNLYAFEMEQCVPINHDSYAITLKPKNNNNIIVTPIGYHLSVTALINDEYITRSYTPVPVSYLPFACLNTSIPILIKSYSTGILAKYIVHLKKNDSSKWLKLSIPKGNFQLMKLLEYSRIGLLAAGSGITPILGVLDHLLARTNNKIEHIELMFFNKTAEDIWCRDKIETIAKKDNRLTIRHILSGDVDNWTGERGRISESLLRPLNETKSDSNVTFCCGCGPPLFNDLAQKLLIEIGFMEEQLHFFKG